MAKIPNWTLEQVNNISEVAEGEPLARWTEDHGDREASYAYFDEEWTETNDEGEEVARSGRLYRVYMAGEFQGEWETREAARSHAVELLEHEGAIWQEQQELAEDLDGPAYTEEQLEEMTKAELYEVAQEFDVDRRSQMLKPELLEAVKGAVLGVEA